MNESTPSRPTLVRGLGPFMAIAVVVGTVIGSGVFKKPQLIAQNLPDLGWVAFAWTLGGVLALLGALALAEVAVLFPLAGGNYVFLREGYGRLAGFLWGWVEFWIIRAASVAALATIFTESLCDVLMAATGNTLIYWGQKTLTMAIIFVLALVNLRGVRWGGGLQLLITIVKVGSLVGITMLPWVLLATHQAPSDLPVFDEINAGAERPSISFGRFFTAFLGILWSYHGWMNIVPVAGEVRNPQRNLPLALFAGVVIVICVYLGANLAYHRVLPMSTMAGLKDTSVSTAFTIRLLGSVGGLIASVALMCSVFGALNGNLLVGPRVLYAMGEDGLAPRALGAIHPRYHTPALAILVMAGWSILLVLGVAFWTLLQQDLVRSEFKTVREFAQNLATDKSHFDILTDFAMFGAITFETLAVTTIFVFRWRIPNAPRAYRCVGYPVVPALYLIIPALLLTNYFMSKEARLEALTATGFILLGAVVYFLVYYRAKGGVR